MNVLLTSVGRRNYLVEYFKEAVQPYGGKVFAVNSHENAPALYLADEFEIAPPIFSEEYIPFLFNYCIKRNIKLIVPLLDNDLPVLAEAKLIFENAGIYVLVLELSLARMANDKLETYRFLQKNGFQTVTTITSLDDFFTARQNGTIDFPVVIKPRWGMGSLSVYIAEDEEELRFYFKKAKKEVIGSFLKHESSQDSDNEILIMEKIIGEEYMLDIINDLNGHHQVTVVNKKLLRKGGETESVATVSHHKLEQLGRTISFHFHHPLVLDADVIVNEKGLFILEFNPRFSGGYPFSHQAGINLPKALIKWLNGESVSKELLLTPKIGTRSMKGIVMINTVLNQINASINGQIVSKTIL